MNQYLIKLDEAITLTPSWSILFQQLKNILLRYSEAIKKVEGKYSDAEYLAWISVRMDSSQWPTTGEYPDARVDKEFREFREVFKELDNAMEPLKKAGEILYMFDWDIIPKYTRDEYRERYLKEVPGGVPF